MLPGEVEMVKLFYRQLLDAWVTVHDYTVEWDDTGDVEDEITEACEIVFDVMGKIEKKAKQEGIVLVTE